MFGSKKSYRNINGVLLLDKPVGFSSNQALQVAKRLFHAQKAGHTGSLDPIASGLLIICLGEATKISRYLLEADKHYVVGCKLGIKTTTGDTEGEVVKRRLVADYTDDRLRSVLRSFIGSIEQIPPMYSALKRNGKRLYQLARDGVEVEREPRSVTIHELKLIERSSNALTLDIKCSKGTYIRTLVEDVGEALDCGAHVAELRRVGVGPYTDIDMVSLDRLRTLADRGYGALDEVLQPVDSALASWPALMLTKDMTFYARSGQPVLVPGSPQRGLVRLYGADGAFLGLGKMLDDGRVAPKRLIFVG